MTQKKPWIEWSEMSANLPVTILESENISEQTTIWGDLPGIISEYYGHETVDMTIIVCRHDDGPVEEITVRFPE